MMTLFYHAFIELILSFSLVSWFGNLSLKNRSSLNQTVKWSGRLIGESQCDPASLHTRQLQQITSLILKDDSHPLHSEFQLLPSGRRFIVPRCRTQQYKNSFVPAAITQMNKTLQHCTDAIEATFIYFFLPAFYFIYSSGYLF